MREEEGGKETFFTCNEYEGQLLTKELILWWTSIIILWLFLFLLFLYLSLFFWVFDFPFLNTAVCWLDSALMSFYTGTTGLIPLSFMNSTSCFGSLQVLPSQDPVDIPCTG